MATGVYGYWFIWKSHNFTQLRFRSDPLPPGSRAHASVALASVVQEAPNLMDWPIYATAVIESYSTYLPDGRESPHDEFPQPTSDDDLPLLFVENACRIQFRVEGQRVALKGQASIVLY